ncbi:MAG TPA: 16S rRNA (guanine(966)-N(2))-methyltransferase RsmD [Acidobacteriota bacterium]|nr:16S rRNA (guanine(966)-N(2))-methyltransferase RsmD [Acidobacteriota bacterium]
MRIIAGRFKRRGLAPLKADIRPTSDRLRGAVFDALGPRIQGAVFLDAMAGSGAMGLEALSRGAGYVIFNERDRAARRLIEKNISLCGVEDGYEISTLDVFVLLREFQPAAATDILYFDPPYSFGRYPKLIQRLAISPLLGSHSLAVIESFKRTDLGPLPQVLEQVNELTAGDSAVRFFQRRKASPDSPPQP